MKLFLKTLSYIGLVLTLIPCFLVFTTVISPELSKMLMITGTFLWFGTSVFWIKKDKISM